MDRRLERVKKLRAPRKRSTDVDALGYVSRDAAPSVPYVRTEAVDADANVEVDAFWRDALDRIT